MKIKWYINYYEAFILRALNGLPQLSMKLVLFSTHIIVMADDCVSYISFDSANGTQCLAVWMCPFNFCCRSLIILEKGRHFTILCIFTGTNEDVLTGGLQSPFWFSVMCKIVLQGDRKLCLLQAFYCAICVTAGNVFLLTRAATGQARINWWIICLWILGWTSSSLLTLVGNCQKSTITIFERSLAVVLMGSARIIAAGNRIQQII